MDETLARRERQIMDVIYQIGDASVGDVREAMKDPPSYSTVRTILGTLERKGHLQHRREGNRYVYLPARSQQVATESALRRLLTIFFDNSSARAVAALLKLSSRDMSEDELSELGKMIDEAKRAEE